INVDDELVAELAAENLVSGGDDGPRDVGLEPSERRVGFGGGLFHEDGGGDEIGRGAATPERGGLPRPHRLDPAVGVSGNLQLTQWVALRPKAISHFP